jgi:hypothetical protein
MNLKVVGMNAAVVVTAVVEAVIVAIEPSVTMPVTQQWLQKSIQAFRWVSAVALQAHH